jgi:hypothetical protein
MPTPTLPPIGIPSDEGGGPELTPANPTTTTTPVSAEGIVHCAV